MIGEARKSQSGISMSMKSRIGFMQGRLSSVVDGQIQSFPWKTWRDEFEIGSRLGFTKMEWTLDSKDLLLNPILVSESQGLVQTLSEESGISIDSVTCDCMMQKPFWKEPEDRRYSLTSDFMHIAEMSSRLGIRLLVVPLVDNGSLNSPEEENT